MAYRIRSFNAAFTRALPSRIDPIRRIDTYFFKIHAVLMPISLGSIVILSSHLRLGLLKGIFPVSVSVPVKIFQMYYSAQIYIYIYIYIYNVTRNIFPIRKDKESVSKILWNVKSSELNSITRSLVWEYRMFITSLL